MKILVLDNYDSFTYNLVYIVRQLGYGTKMDVFRNDKISLEDIDQYDKIILSPGPGLPSEAGIMPELLKQYAETKSILGVCLGHQAIGEAFGGSLINLSEVLHGVASNVTIQKDLLFEGIPDTFNIGRYHSWVIDESTLSPDLEVIARTPDQQIMAVRHKKLNVRGVQFHPESILTENGVKIMQNWLKS
ncbi:anthranilate synthase component II [Algoriphagus boritolerans]|uniref:Anthranilate synthase component 2 n=1 Tax=Algoriphagus boritolerans DSM 17298 = JCM 18970 TaxID=1120964 RepID=A0A1H5WDR7_9BACT|nr:aminodeoxychorismate/anthranilate synthase component II [Algoriphagus boritolerans]SEF97396.1 anthranilate synthase component 2 [Algoriphagus boritolerans DSM 17298 = JCM 18970]